MLFLLISINRQPEAKKKKKMLRRKFCQKHELIKIEFTVHNSQKVLIHLWSSPKLTKAVFSFCILKGNNYVYHQAKRWIHGLL